MAPGSLESPVYADPSASGGRRDLGYTLPVTLSGSVLRARVLRSLCREHPRAARSERLLEGDMANEVRLKITAEQEGEGTGTAERYRAPGNANVEDYIACCNKCKGMFPQGSPESVECVRGCASASRSM